MKKQTPQAVTIAGSDSGGCAGVQADLKTFQNRKVFGMNIFVALTAQNTLGVQESLAVPPAFITAQFKSLAADYEIKAAKTGMLFDKEHVQTVVDNYKKVDFGPLIVDPVMIAKGGHPLLQKAAVDTIRQALLPLAFVVTPNLPEAEILIGSKIKTKKEVKKAAYQLQKMGVNNVIIKGGHFSGEQSTDYVLSEEGNFLELSAPRIMTK